MYLAGISRLICHGKADAPAILLRLIPGEHKGCHGLLSPVLINETVIRAADLSGLPLHIHRRAGAVLLLICPGEAGNAGNIVLCREGDCYGRIIEPKRQDF